MGKARVLIVDDHKDVLAALRQLIELDDFAEVVGAAASGRDAIEQAMTLHPDLVLMDFSMGDMDGVEAARRIHEHEPSTDVIILSVYEPQEDAERAREAGVLRWIQKSSPPEALLKELRSLSARQM